LSLQANIYYNDFKFTFKTRSTFFKMAIKTISEHELVEKSMSELCKKAGFANCGSLVQRDMEFLCESIESKTGVLISLSTMRRLMKGEFSRLPQVATLNAIALFLEYKSWQDFKINKEQELQATAFNETTKVVASLQSLSSNTISKKWFWLSAIILLFVSTGLFALLKPGKRPAGNFEKAVFSINKTTRNDLPNTVIFNYNIDDVNADSFFIQQSWDKNRRVRIDKKKHTLTDIYYEPGYHIAKLIANDQVIKTLDVSIPTDRWFFYAKEKIPRSIPVYIHSLYKPADSLLRINKEELINSGVDIQKENEYLYVYFPSVIETSSDNYILKFRIRVSGVRNNFCPYFMCEVFCQKNFMFFTSTPKGCASEIKVEFGEKYVSGKNNDLSLLGSNVTDWQNVELSVKDKKATAKINGANVFSSAYDQSGGLITGFGFISNGLCEVDGIDFKTPDGKIIYNNEHGK
jgi:DNA-binding cell septation regulator SpoVG